jgi:HAD superfamily hydrolase (TIGR01509 family)
MNKIKAILLDADGLVFKKERYFSEIFAEEYGVSKDLILPFFKNNFRQCQQGNADLKEELKPFLQQWNWEGTVESFLEYWFSFCVADEEVLKTVRSLREKGYKCYLVTDQEKYRGEYIKKNLKLENELDGFFYSFELESSKSEKEFYEKILKELKLSSEEVIFFDDEQENVEIANELGIQSVLVNGAGDFEQVVNQLSLPK